MKVEFLGKCLRIIAEDGVEAYALDKWFTGYINKGAETLQINIDAGRPHNEKI